MNSLPIEFKKKLGATCGSLPGVGCITYQKSESESDANSRLGCSSSVELSPIAP